MRSCEQLMTSRGGDLCNLKALLLLGLPSFIASSTLRLLWAVQVDSVSCEKGTGNEVKGQWGVVGLLLFEINYHCVQYEWALIWTKLLLVLKLDTSKGTLPGHCHLYVSVIRMAASRLAFNPNVRYWHFLQRIKPEPDDEMSCALQQMRLQYAAVRRWFSCAVTK